VSMIRICLRETAVQFYRHCKGIRKEWRRGSFTKHGQLPRDDLGEKTNTANENAGILTQAIKLNLEITVIKAFPLLVCYAV